MSSQQPSELSPSGRSPGPGAAFRAFRRKLLTPGIAETTIEVRGFHDKDPEARELLETVGRSFLEGYSTAVEKHSVHETVEFLTSVPHRFRGFAYEGAGMGLAMLDGLPLGGDGRVAGFLDTEAGSKHVYVVHVGIGWAMARLPHFRWPSAENLDPLLRWLVLDGYGFHQAYFHTRKYVHEQFQDRSFGWPDKARGGYANRVVDQGIGRAMWFVGGADPQVVAELIEKFPAARWSDLYSGAGLAAAYAGGATKEELLRFRDRAGSCLPALAQGCAFGAEARVRGEIVGPHTELATSIFCGTTAEEAALATLEVRPANPVDGELPAYETWRRAISRQFVTLGGAGT
ncbi:DUF1702 family protein [Amycolatopsis sp. QT-25]|uniref:DUF1702 family protein n=1 Tax=Amycolatopsis sp. QT-25 TaxID=3034022 RepID=UPI0023EAC3B3|nr:DUF1702 family protein [Amycolatopsis sp. QT-25]WET83088.1 DUF1702 family protein [Amycolatopsis sp. QT-25]